MSSALMISKGCKPRKGLVKSCPVCRNDFYVSQAFKTQSCCSYRCRSLQLSSPIELKEGEELRMVSFLPKYAVTNYGRVVSYQRNPSGALMAGALNKRRGYFGISLWSGGVQYTHAVHRLVAMAFLPNPKNLPEVNHKDGNRLNNNLENLEWCSGSENVLHSYRELGHIRMRGERSGNAKLSHRQVEEIRALRGKHTYKNIAEQYGVKYSTIAHIMRGSRWSHELDKPLEPITKPLGSKK